MDPRDRPLRRVAGSQFQQRLGRLGGKMIRQGQKRVLVGHLLDVIQPLGGYAIVQQLAVRHTGEHGALGGDVARDLDLAHHLADLDELRRSGVRMLFKEPALSPAIRIVVLPDIAEQEIGRRLVHNHAHAVVDPNRPEVLVPGPVHPMELQSRLRRIELQIERRRLRGPLLRAVQLCEALSKGIGYAELHVFRFRVEVAVAPAAPTSSESGALDADRCQADLEGGEGTHQGLLVFRHQRRNTL